MKFIISLLLLVKLSTVLAQTEIQAKNKDTEQVNSGFLLGFWTEETTKYKIEFKIYQNELVLVQNDYYTFNILRTDSFPLTGLSITWPPHDCIIKKLDKNSIEIQYTLFGNKPELAKYKRD